MLAAEKKVGESATPVLKPLAERAGAERSLTVGDVENDEGEGDQLAEHTGESDLSRRHHRTNVLTGCRKMES